LLTSQFDEEFIARQEAQAALQKREEKIKELETEIKRLRSQVIKLRVNFSVENYLYRIKSKML